MRVLVIAALVSFALAGEAMAYCFEPKAPVAPPTYGKPTAPQTPMCIDEIANTHNCDDGTISAYNREIDQFNNQVESYIRDLQSYLSEVDRYVNEAVAYARCEANSL